MIVALVPELADRMSSADHSCSGLGISDPGTCFDQKNSCFEEHVCECSKTAGGGIIAINVGGQIYQTKRSTLKRYPDTLLGMFWWLQN